MSAFDALRMAGSGLGMHQTWLDVLGNNIANVNTYTSTADDAFQAQMLVASARSDGGVQVTGIEESSAEGRLVYMPDHPLADADGFVRAPDMDMEAQMSELIMAQRGFQASAQVTKYAQDTYGTAIQIGK
ncbi:flagellar basal body rod C-terminal domain-containing protein [Nocardioides sp. GY 10127]|uniref:flagellar basal body rod protein FlgC n=1 Tax=Nocardioides sp. GY 10127 TaxID=2569762 RepID=UPI0010A91958|nr:flagellar basal body rod C-terminal domain-containing protein [Nocardioides sp. GY 10127]TIC78626.1 flagellar basal-body rod protein FlgC [Nocardioides sp. GY 10127]